LSMRLAQTLGKSSAHHHVEVWSQTVVRQARPLREVVSEALRDDPSLAPSLGATELDALFDADAAAVPARLSAQRQIESLRMQWAALGDAPSLKARHDATT
jgi:hypothetical protein